MFDLYRLNIFLTVAREGSFNRAGQKLGMSAAGVSQHMQKLEAELRQKLFERSRRGVTLTEAGQSLLVHGQRLLDMSSEAKQALSARGFFQKNEVNVGATPGVSVYLMPDWLHCFRRDYPETTIHLHTGVTSQIVSELVEGKHDIAFVEGEVNQLDHKLGLLVLENVEQLVIVGPQHAWWQRPSVTIDELDGQSFIVRQRSSHTRQWLEQTLLQHGVRPVISAEFDNPESIKRAVANGACLTVLPLYAVQQEVKLGLLHAIQIEGQPLMRQMQLLWNRQQGLSRSVHAFVQQLNDRYPTLRTLPAPV